MHTPKEYLLQSMHTVKWKLGTQKCRSKQESLLHLSKLFKLPQWIVYLWYILGVWVGALPPAEGSHNIDKAAVVLHATLGTASLLFLLLLLIHLQKKNKNKKKWNISQWKEHKLLTPKQSTGNNICKMNRNSVTLGILILENVFMSYINS